MSDQAQTASTEAAPVVTEPTTTPEIAVTTEGTPPTPPPSEATPAPENPPSSSEEPQLTDEQIQAIVDELSKDLIPWQATEPQFFPKKDEEIKDDVTALKVAIEKSEQASAEAEQYKAKTQELEGFVETVKSAYGNVTQFLGTDIADKIAAGQFDDVPAWFHEDKRAKVESHPYIGPLVNKLMAWEEVDLPALVREAAKKITLPAVDVPAPPSETPKPQNNPAQNLVKGLRSRHGL